MLSKAKHLNSIEILHYIQNDNRTIDLMVTYLFAVI
jgi:hypothetical protein